MRRSRADRRRAGAAAALAWLLASCAAIARVDDVRNHPPLLVGEWVDVAKSTPADSSIWVLDARGNDDLLRVRRDSRGVARVSRTRYGYWYATVDGGGTSLCITRRPGRDPALCSTATIAGSNWVPACEVSSARAVS